MNWISYDDLKDRLTQLKNWLTYYLARKIDTVQLNQSTYTTTNGTIDLGEIYGDEILYTADGSSSVSAGWQGWVRAFRFRLHRGTGGSSAIGSFNALGNYYAPNGVEVGQLLVYVSGNRKDSPTGSEPWRGQNGFQNFVLKLLSNTSGAISEEDFILAIDKTNSHFGTSDGVVVCELWVRQPASKNYFKWYYSNASVMGSKVTVKKDYKDAANWLYLKIFSNSGIRKLITCTSNAIGNTTSGGYYKLDTSTSTTATLADSIKSVDTYKIYQVDGVTEHTGIKQAVAQASYSATKITRDQLKNYADTDSTTGNRIWTDHDATVNAPYFAVAQFDKIEYYLIKCNEPVQS